MHGAFWCGFLGYDLKVIWIRILIGLPTKFILVKKTSSKHYCFILTNMYQNINKMESDFPTTSGQIHPTSGHSDWLN